MGDVKRKFYNIKNLDIKMICKTCGAELKENAKFCFAYGEKTNYIIDTLPKKYSNSENYLEQVVNDLREISLEVMCDSFEILDKPFERLQRTLSSLVYSSDYYEKLDKELLSKCNSLYTKIEEFINNYADTLNISKKIIYLYKIDFDISTISLPKKFDFNKLFEDFDDDFFDINQELDSYYMELDEWYLELSSNLDDLADKIEQIDG